MKKAAFLLYSHHCCPMPVTQARLQTDPKNKVCKYLGSFQLSHRTINPTRLEKKKHLGGRGSLQAEFTVLTEPPYLVHHPAAHKVSKFILSTHYFR